MSLKMTLNILFEILKGGPGSGNWGHSSRPGKRGGSAPRSAGLSPTTGPDWKARQAATKGIVQVLNHGLATGNEAIVGYDKDGKPIDGMPTGSNKDVNATAVFHADTYVTIHNHPNSSSFSDEDISSFMSLPGKHMIVIGHDGTIYKMTKPNSFEFPNLSSEDITRRFDAFHLRLKEKYLPKVKNKELTPNEAWKEQTHEVVSMLTQRFGLDYQRILPSE